MASGFTAGHYSSVVVVWRLELGMFDATALAAELRALVRGEVRFDNGSRALYATDSSNYRQIPIGVVIPQEINDVIKTVATCRRFGVPVLPRGGGTSLAGQCCNVAVVLDMSKYVNNVLEVDPLRKLARVQPGTVLDTLRDAAEQYHLTFGPDPATHRWCTLGGMVGNNSCGVHSVMAGRTSENIEELEILTYDGLRLRVGKTSEQELAQIIAAGGRRGEIYAGLKMLRDKYGDLIRARYPDIPRRVSGYNLPQLLPEHGFHVARALVGSEGTCVTILEATTRLVHSPPARSLVVLGYTDIYTAGDHLMEVLAHQPVGLEAIDDILIDNMKEKGLRPDEVALLPDGGGWLLAEFGGDTRQEANDRARELMQDLQGKNASPSMKLFDNPAMQHKIWEVRESGLGATALVPGEKATWEGWEDSAVPPEKVGSYLRDLRALYDHYGYHGSFYGHFGDGCVHTRIDFDLQTHEGIQRFRSFLDAAADLVVSYGGSFSGEHGDGQSRAALLPKMFGSELVRAFKEFKAIWDPEAKMNPGKLVDAYQPTENLRLGTNYHPSLQQTYFQFPDDQGSFANATLRCVGVGKCRRESGGTMCPSYMVTREEKHTTRGRARLLFELLEGEAIGRNGWKDEHVKEALDLCLACKGCKRDCPVNVDMATYKAEFLAHYFKNRLRPRSAYAFGLIPWWSRVASFLPQVINFFTQTPMLREVAKLVAGMAPQRQIPTFAPQTFTSWFRQRGVRNADKPQVLLWPDTFNNYFHPTTAQASVAVLEAVGYQVVIPSQSLCCGRPLYDYGVLDLAKHQLRNILSALQPQIAAGIPLVGLEPSCTAIFRDELINLFPHDEDAKRLHQQTFTLSEFLTKNAREYQFLPLHGRALVQRHCHHQAVMGYEADEAVLAKLGLDYDILDSGCCGMAGSFGFEKDHYEVSIKCGERALLPAVRNAALETLIIADGFSCREQIAQNTDRHALHLAQVLQRALRRDDRQLPAYPKTQEIGQMTSEHPSLSISTVALVGAGDSSPVSRTVTS